MCVEQAILAGKLWTKGHKLQCRLIVKVELFSFLHISLSEYEDEMSYLVFSVLSLSDTKLWMTIKVILNVKVNLLLLFGRSFLSISCFLPMCGTENQCERLSRRKKIHPSTRETTGRTFFRNIVGGACSGLWELTNQKERGFKETGTKTKR